MRKTQTLVYDIEQCQKPVTYLQTDNTQKSLMSQIYILYQINIVPMKVKRSIHHHKRNEEQIKKQQQAQENILAEEEELNQPVNFEKYKLEYNNIKVCWVFVFL
jgi:hypothetical protein